MASAAARPAPVEIPDRLYFRIGDVARLAGVETHVLRFWEGEFSMLSPKKSGANQRLYRRKDVETVLEIKRLLYERRFTIEGARAELAARRGHRAARAAARPEAVPKPRAASFQQTLFGLPQQQLAGIKQELDSILKLLS
jgi:DNA-binding transcriptional MerR regulator